MSEPYPVLSPASTPRKPSAVLLELLKGMIFERFRNSIRGRTTPDILAGFEPADQEDVLVAIGKLIGSGMVDEDADGLFPGPRSGWRDESNAGEGGTLVNPDGVSFELSAEDFNVIHAALFQREADLKKLGLLDAYPDVTSLVDRLATGSRDERPAVVRVDPCGPWADGPR